MSIYDIIVRVKIRIGYFCFWSERRIACLVGRPSLSHNCALLTDSFRQNISGVSRLRWCISLHLTSRTFPLLSSSLLRIDIDMQGVEWIIQLWMLYFAVFSTTLDAALVQDKSVLHVCSGMGLYYREIHTYETSAGEKLG